MVCGGACACSPLKLLVEIACSIEEKVELGNGPNEPIEMLLEGKNLPTDQNAVKGLRGGLILFINVFDLLNNPVSVLEGQKLGDHLLFCQSLMFLSHTLPLTHCWIGLRYRGHTTIDCVVNLSVAVSRYCWGCEIEVDCRLLLLLWALLLDQGTDGQVVLAMLNRPCLTTTTSFDAYR